MLGHIENGRARSGLIVHLPGRLPGIGARGIDFSVPIALAFFLFTVFQYWNNWAVDLSAYYYAGHFYGTGQFDQVFAGPPQIIGPQMPDAWVAAVAQSGHAGEQTYPFIYPPWVAAVMAPISKAFTPMQVMNGAAVLNAAMMTASIFLAWRIMAPRQTPRWLWVVISVALLTTSSTSVLALALGQVQILVFFLCLLAFERYRARAFWVAGAALALAAAIKITPAALAVIFLWDRNWRALGGFFAVIAAVAAFSMLVVGGALNQQYFQIMDALNSQIFIAILAYSIEGFILQISNLYQGIAPVITTNEYIYPKPEWIDLAAKGVFLAGLVAAWLATRKLPAAMRMPRQLLALSLLVPIAAPLGWVHYFLLTAYLLPGLLEHLEHKLPVLLIAAFAFLLGAQTMSSLIWPGLRYMPTIMVSVPFLIVLFAVILAFGRRTATMGQPEPL